MKLVVSNLLLVVSPESKNQQLKTYLVVIVFLFILFPLFLLAREAQIGFGGGLPVWKGWSGYSQNIFFEPKISRFFGFNLFGSWTDVENVDRKISFATIGGMMKGYLSIIDAGIGYGFIPSFSTNNPDLPSAKGITSPLFSIGLRGRISSISLGFENIFIPKLRSFYNPSLAIGYNIPIKRKIPEKPPKPKEPEEVAEKPTEPPKRPKYPAEEVVKRPERLPPYLEIISLNLKDKNNDGFLDAMETGSIELTVHNKGKGNGYNLKVLVSPLENYEGLRLEDSEIELIRINETKLVRIPIAADKWIKTQEVKLRVDVKEPFWGADADPKVLVFSTKRLEPPDVLIAQTGVDDDEAGESMGNSNSKIELGETVELTTILQNIGTGTADNTTIRILPLKENEVMYLGEDSTISVGSMKPGEWKPVVLPIYVSKRFEGDKFTLRLNITESKLNITKDTTLIFSLNRPFQKPSEIVVQPKPIVEEKIEIQPLPELTAEVDTNIPITGIKNEYGIAVVVGVADYKREVPKVEYALRDARIIKEYLINMFGYKEENIIFLRNPTKADFEMVFGIKDKPKGQLFNFTKPNESDVFVYYTGHGAPDKEKKGYLVPADADPSYVEFQGYPLDLLFENLSQIPAKSITVVIDACFSGAYDRGMIISKASPITVIKIEKVKGLAEKGILITSCSEEEISSWYPEKRHSLFTYFFLKGLRGEADKDKNKEINLSELEGYLKDNVSYWAGRLYNRQQNPKFEGERSSVIVKLK